MATSCQASRPQTRPFVQHLKNRRALHLNTKWNSENDLCPLSKTEVSNYHRHNAETSPNSRNENLARYHENNLHRALSEAHCRKLKCHSSISRNRNTKLDISSPQLCAVAEKYEDVVSKVRPQKTSSRLHLRLHTSEDLRQVRVDGSPFEVRWNYDLSRPLVETLVC
jgi:hypothetical protein